MSEPTPPPNPQAGLIRVLPGGYIGKRQPEYWTLAETVANMSATLSTLSYHNFNTKKTERARVILGMVCEYVEGNLIVKAFYDWDVPAPPNMTPLTNINSQEELDAEEAKLKENQAEQLVEFKRAMALAHPDVDPENFAFAKRSGWKAKKKTACWVISLRCFVQGRSMYISDILTHIKAIFESNGVKMFPQLDGSVYKPTEQCLAIVGGHKETNDKRVLVPLTHTDQLEAFIIQDVENCTLMSPARPAAVPSSVASSSASSASAAPPKRARVEAADAPLVSKMSRKVPRLGGNSAILNYLQTQFKVDSNLIHLDKVTMFPISAGTGSTQATGFTIPTTCRLCPFLKREHNSNHVYFTVNCSGSRGVNVVLKCHDSECAHNARGTDRTLMSADVENAFRHITSAGTEEPILELNSHSEISDTSITDTGITDGMRKDAVLHTLGKLQKQFPKMDCSIVDDADILQASKVGSGGYVTMLKNNRWCPLHKKEHDCPDNWLHFSTAVQQLLCKQSITDALSLPLDKSQINIIFANININLTNNSDSPEVRDFGQLEHFPNIFENPEMNTLCYHSLSNGTYSFAAFAAKMIEGKYVWQKVWYRFTGKYWKASMGPDALFVEDIARVYYKLQETYNSEKQIKWLNILIEDLRSLSKRKVYLEELERFLFENTDTPVPFDGKPHLIGFQNGVYDSATCEFREHRAEDFLTILLPYELPKTHDIEIQRQLHYTLATIIPNDSVRDYLLLLLALHLEGNNKHAVGMIWSGTGGNGKGVLKDLMRYTFDCLHSEPPATFLTSERPSPEKPAPHLVDLRIKRSVFTSEPEAGKRANSAFIKFITGGDPVSCRACHSNDMISFVPMFLVTLLCNTIPLFQGGQEEVRALWRRLKIFHFPTEFVDELEPGKTNQQLKDPYIREKLAGWGPEFMLMLIDIFEDYARNGRKLTKAPPEVEKNLEEQKSENNPLEAFMSSSIKRPGNLIHTHKVLAEFGEFLRREQISSTGHAFTTTALTRRLEAMGYTVSDSNHKRPECCKSTCRCLMDVELMV